MVSRCVSCEINARVKTNIKELCNECEEYYYIDCALDDLQTILDQCGAMERVVMLSNLSTIYQSIKLI